MLFMSFFLHFIYPNRDNYTEFILNLLEKKIIFFTSFVHLWIWFLVANFILFWNEEMNESIWKIWHISVNILATGFERWCKSAAERQRFEWWMKKKPFVWHVFDRVPGHTSQINRHTHITVCALVNCIRFQSVLDSSVEIRAKIPGFLNCILDKLILY